MARDTQGLPDSTQKNLQLRRPHLVHVVLVQVLLVVRRPQR